MILSDDYYPALTRSNVELVTEGIARIVPNGIETSDGRVREVDTIIFATSDEKSGLWRVSAAGGSPTALTTPDAAQHEIRHAFPFMLPGSRSVLFTTRPRKPPRSRARSRRSAISTACTAGTAR